MKVREAYFVRNGWYPGNKEKCEADINSYIKDIGKEKIISGDKIGGIVPHAGWMCSGKIAAMTFLNLKETKPELILIYGGHKGTGSPAIITENAWETPFGEIEIDTALVKEVQSSVQCEADYAIDNTIELNLPFIKFFFPDSKILALRMPATEKSISASEKIADLLKRKGISFITVGSSDLTHYGMNYGFAPHGIGIKGLEWVKNTNDKQLIDCVLKMDAEETIQHAARNSSACSSGAIAGTIAAAKFMGAKKGNLVEYTTSYDVLGDASSFVGYTSIVFSR